MIKKKPKQPQKQSQLPLPPNPSPQKSLKKYPNINKQASKQKEALNNYGSF